MNEIFEILKEARRRGELPRKMTRHELFELITGITVVVIAVLWLIVFTDRVVMPLIVLSGIENRVPDLHFMNIDEADSTCRALGLELIRGRTRIDDRLSPGTILDQFPVAGVTFKPGRRIEVVISDRAQMVTCPKVLGRSPREAMIIADSAGLALIREHIRYQHSKWSPEGVVIVQEPKPMTEMKRGDELKLIVSLGERPLEIVAPDLVGMQLDGIGIALAKYGLRLGKVTRFPDRTAPAETVISQSPSPGTPMGAGDRVELCVTVAPVTGSGPAVKNDASSAEEMEDN